MRVARELHDEFGQGISGLGMALHSWNGVWDLGRTGRENSRI